jgi:hypothetical protein
MTLLKRQKKEQKMSEVRKLHRFRVFSNSETARIPYYTSNDDDNNNNDENNNDNNINDQNNNGDSAKEI